jgi:hypothetical protein
MTEAGTVQQAIILPTGRHMFLLLRQAVHQHQEFTHSGTAINKVIIQPVTSIIWQA